jgi:hypothetical protein
MSYYFFWGYRSRGATAAEAEALYAEVPKSVKKNILRSSHENKLNRCEEWNVYSS